VSSEIERITVRFAHCDPLEASFTKKFEISNFDLVRDMKEVLNYIQTK